MSLEKYTDLELTRLLKSLILERNDISQRYKEESFELINQFNLLPSVVEYEDIIRIERKTLDKLYDKLIEDTQNYVRKIRVYYEQEVSKYQESIHNNFYTYSIDEFIDYAYEVSKFLEDNSLDLVHIGINQANIDKFNAQLFDLKKLNNELTNKIKEWEENRKSILTNIKFRIADLQSDK